MRDIADLVFEDPPSHFADRPATPPLDGTTSPLRPWGMWGGWAAIGIACAGAVAHAVTRIRPRHRVVPELSPPRPARGVIVPAG
jgi:hypothetical protein